MTPFEDPFNDPIRPSVEGLTPTQYRIANERLQCSVHGCGSKRNGPTPYCLPHYRKICRYGSLTRCVHLKAWPLRKLERHALALLNAPSTEDHPTVYRALDDLTRLLHKAKGMTKSREQYLHRLAVANPDPREVIAVATSVYTHLWRTDPEAYEDGPYAVSQVSRLIMRRLVPARYLKRGEVPSHRRAQGMVGPILECIGPLVALLIQTLERNRRAKEARKLKRQERRERSAQRRQMREQQQLQQPQPRLSAATSSYGAQQQ